MDGAQIDPVVRFRELLVESIRPLVSGLGIRRGDLKAKGAWRDGQMHITVRDVGCPMDVHVSSLAVGEAWAPRIVETVQAALDEMGIEQEDEWEA